MAIESAPVPSRPEASNFETPPANARIHARRIGRTSGTLDGGTDVAVGRGMQPGPQCPKILFAIAAAATLTIADQRTSRAESAPALPGFASLGQVLLDKDGCASCPVVFATSRRHRAFAFASDSPFPVNQSGRIEVTCANGSTYHVFLHSPLRSGLFQVVSNDCVNLDAKQVTLTITSVSLSPQDAERTVALLAYASFA